MQHVDVHEVARREVELLVVGLDQDQHVVEAELGQLADQHLGLRRLELELAGHDQAFLPREFGEQRADRAAIHLAVDLLRVNCGLPPRTRGRRRPRSGCGWSLRARRPGALLVPRLRPPPRTSAFVSCALVPGTARGRVGRQDLVHQRLVELAAEGSRRRVRISEPLAPPFTSLSFIASDPRSLLRARRRDLAAASARRP
mgnify:CR=1 FL=1